MAAQTIILNGFTAVSQGNYGLWLHLESRLCTELNHAVFSDLARPMAEELAGMAAE